ncbi:MAG TPA: response regulator [Labilithrix sp.]|jgi:DNA-binding NtrC family response regulator|nr:response regulator [Labilithrix sp.]
MLTPAPPAGEVGTPSAARKGRIMIVDDDPALLDALEFALSLQGHEVVKADSGTVAVAIARDESLDLVLTDFKMPGMNGLETMIAIKEQNPSIPVMIVTGFASPEMFDDFKRHGALSVVRKPFNLSDLFAAVGQALQA